MGDYDYQILDKVNIAIMTEYQSFGIQPMQFFAKFDGHGAR